MEELALILWYIMIILLDSIRADLNSIDGQLNYTLSVINNPNNTYPYHGSLQGALYEHGLKTHATILDNKGKTGFDLAMKAAMKGRGIELSITSPQSILGYKSFAVNDSNYIYIGRDRRLSANLRLEAADGTGMLVSTEDNDSTSLQNVTLSMNHFELGSLFEILPLHRSCRVCWTVTITLFRLKRNSRYQAI